MLNTVWKI